MKYRLEELVDLQIGRTPPRKEFEWFNTNGDGYKWVSIKDMGNSGRFISDTSEYLTEAAQKRFGIPIVEKGTLLLSFKLTVGRLCITTDRMLTNEAIAQLPIKDTNIVDRDFLYYYLKNYNFHQLGSTSSIATAINSTYLKKMEIDLPPIDQQRAIAAVLSSIDDKIESNNAINNNLEQQARALFVSWFINFDPWNGVCPNEWSDGVLGDYVTIKRGGSPRPIQDYLSDTGYRWLKISDATAILSPFILSIKEHIKESGLSKTVFLRRGALVLSNSATPGIPKILDIDSCIHDGWLYFPESKFSNEYLYLFFKEIRSHLVSLGNGSVFTNLKTDILKNYPVRLPSDLVLKDFDAVVKPLFRMILHCTRENQHLCEVRDTLIPKFLSGVVDVSEVSVD